MTALLGLVDAIGLLAGSFLLALLLQHLRLSWMARRFRPPAGTAVPDAGLPAVLVQVPFYNEAASVEGALASAAALDWPREKLTIQLLDDSTDDTGCILQAAIGRLPPGGPAIDHVRRAHRSGFKAGALAAGLARSVAPMVAILDVDFRAPPDWLRVAVAALLADERAAFVQFRFEFANRDRNWMTRGQQLSVDTHFCAEQAGRAAGREPFQFNGTGAVWRRAAIEDAGGWSADTLAEDLDLTFRAYAAGWHGLLALEPALQGEAPADIGAWRVQQARWSTGFVQVARKALPLIWRAAWPLPAKLGASLLLGLQAGLPCFLLAAGALLLDGGVRGFGPVHGAIATAAAIVAGVSAVAITLPPFKRLRRGGIVRYVATLTTMPALLVFLAIANSGAVMAAPFAARRDFVRTPKTGRK
ncbi:glycosyltransferase family 2 protein [Labrys monachus]|uniref:Cellulose synthase/poly-beta-1,6-N-acetylglucosamine synthase-like glycosyltransferase n=1 Tax=Labrys monachus TaxID=217067 RepID=A0ABU0FD60_9HYPH|nr:glycosyltransferase family 2 protein [Labrys monachus]MDQ0392267.1 cellulose synthase/poly-beta-1,6-N-acetylglucosamine synthase-like glycosyltransferase [Labrys monachus]